MADRASSRGRRAWRAAFFVALAVLVASLAALGVIAYSYFQGQQKYGEVADAAGFDPSGLDDAANSADAPLDQVRLDWDALLATNPDTVGWLYIPGTAVNYPIVQGEDNDHYLAYDFDGDAGWLAEYGAIFLDYRNDPAWGDAASFVYGHHMRDGSMFAGIAGLADQAAFDASRTVYVLTPAGNFCLRSFALVHCAASDPIVQTGFDTPAHMAAYVQDKLDSSVVQVKDAPAATDVRKLFAFSTCDDYSSGRYVLFASVQEATAALSGEVGLAESPEGTVEGWENDLHEIRE